MPEFSSRDVAKLLDDVLAAIDSVQSMRTPAAKATRALDVLHSRGWKLVPAEPTLAPISAPVANDLDDIIETEPA